MLTKEHYLADPCKAASIPYWKAKSMTVPDGMKILHQDEYDSTEYQHFVDEPYFRLIHNLKGLAEPILPQGYSLCTVTLSEHAAHINSCYDCIASPRMNWVAACSGQFTMLLFGLQSRMIRPAP